ncbi:4Fe-4S dicluster domain-containing protein [Treponema sp. Marseille-Q4132]|uniref:4Fe-4S dicluster domain-containing protein n=1 Tax=Treponema sp. Marseille-Q4132 TaxID=2766701 RepID=UPI0016532CD0|nr:4Fe-4S dicluster domain-containing protein [Treponema sp. Marseille-Q4132]QNL97498.1 4Fe-4S dicluster domain-containing protein [Treponema sp. Marseille-Q4132]
MQSEMTGELVNRAKTLLADKTVQIVLGWRRGLFDYDVTPSLFTSADDIEKNFVYNEYSAANLSKYLVKETRKIETAKNTVRANNAIAKQKDANAETQAEPEAKILVFLKPCDTYSFTELLKEHRIFRSHVYAIGVPCDGMKDPEKQELSERCAVCKSKKHIGCDELIGEDGDVRDSARFDEVAKLEAMTEEERFAFWQNELSRCIRCNACRDVCPACTCTTCVFDNPASGAAQKVAASSFEESMYHIIRAWHVAGRCTDCGECSRVCPQRIPLHLINRKFIKDIDELYGSYTAGSDMETKPPMLTYRTSDAEPDIIYSRSGGTL